MAKKLELSWITSNKQWRKRRKVNGKTKTFYLGTGNGKQDMVAYTRALKKWRDIEKSLIEAETGDRLLRGYELWREELAQRPGIDAALYLIQTLSTVDQTRPLHPSMEKALAGIGRCGEDRFARPDLVPAPDPKAKTLSECVDGYIAEQQKRYEHGLKFPDAPQRERISGVRFMSYRFNANLLKVVWGSEPLPKDEAGMAAAMKQFREFQKAKMIAGEIQAGTVNERTKTMRHFVRWLHEQYLIPHLPRNMADLCAAYTVKTTAIRMYCAARTNGFGIPGSSPVGSLMDI